jgi:predicted nuclease of predicted toxin-antitoxin system
MPSFRRATQWNCPFGRMIIWLDAQLPPQLATWIRSKFLIDATAIRDLGLRDAKDSAI